jgi:hypothetical protein
MQKKLLQWKKHGRKVRTLRRPRRFFRTQTTMNRTHPEPQNVMPTTPKRGADAFGLRALDRRDAGTSID